MKRTIALLLIMVFLVSFSSCGAKYDYSDPLEKNPELLPVLDDVWANLLSEEECMETMGLGNYKDTLPTIARTRAQNDGEYIYYLSKELEFGEGGGNPQVKTQFLRYNLRTGESYSICRDSACLHDSDACPFYGNSIEWYIVADGVLYMLWASTNKGGGLNTSRTGYICSYDPETLEFRFLCERDAGVYNSMHYYDGKIYYVQQEYLDETNRHDKYIWSCDVKTGKTQKLFKYGGQGDSGLQGRNPLMIDEKGRMLFVNYISLDTLGVYQKSTIAFEYAELKKDAEVVRIAEYDGYFEAHSYNTFQYSNGKLYFSEFQEKITYTRLTAGKESEGFILRDAIVYVDVNTGEIGKLPKDAVFGFAIAGDYLYYFPYEPKMYEYEDESGKYQRMVNDSGTVVQRNLKTGEEKVFPVKGNFSLGNAYTYYYRGRIYTNGQDMSERQGRSGPIEIDLISGETRPIDVQLLRTGI